MDYYTVFARLIYPLNAYRNPTLPVQNNRYKASPAQAQVPFVANAPRATVNAQNKNPSRLAAIMQGYRTSNFSVNVFGPSTNVSGGKPPAPSQAPSTPTSPQASSTNVWSRPFPSIPCGPGAEAFFSQVNQPSPHEPAELTVKIGGLRGFLDWNIVRPEVNRFLEYRSNATSNTLTVEWGTSNADKEGWRGRNTLKHLFRLLNDTRFVNGKVYRPTGSFKSISVTVPALVRDIESCDSLGNRTTDDDSIDLQHALRLETFLWKGNFSVLVKKFVNIPFGQITALNVSGCFMSVDDAVALLHSCPNLANATLETLDTEAAKNNNAGSIVKSNNSSRMCFQRLESLKISSNESIRPVLMRIGWEALQMLTLVLGDTANTDIITIIKELRHPVQNLSLTGFLSPLDVAEIRPQFDSFIYNPV